MTERRPYLVAAVAVLALAIALRAIPLAWSPLPATLDAFDYADIARSTLAAGAFPIAEMRADNVGFAGLLAAVGAVTGTRPLMIAQPLVAIAGGASCLVGMALSRRLASATGFSGRAVRVAAVVAGLALAVDGVYLRRTGVPDEEAFALLLLPILVLAVARFLDAGRGAWLGVAGPLALLFPLQHTFSTLMAAISLTGLFATALLAADRRRVLLGAGLVGGFWLYVAAYYDVTARAGLSVPYTDRVTAHPGLFVAWLVVLAVGLVWFRTTSDRARQATVAAPIAVMFLIVVTNTFLPVFPGTVPTPPLLVVPVLALSVPALFAVASVSAVARPHPVAATVLALLAAPVVQTYFALSVSLSPEFFATVLRTQTFAHLPVLVLAGVSVGRLTDASLPTPSRSALRAGAFAVLAVSILVTTPLAFVDLDTAAYPSTTTESEFAIASFAATHVPTWSSDHVITRIATHYFDESGAMGPTASWLRGGPPPDCAVVALDSWTTTGAHFFPAAPATISPEQYAAWESTRNRVYSVAGYDPGVVVVPRGNASAGC